jgi:hypothetical protein
MMMVHRPTLTAEVRLIEFPYFLTETWRRKIGQKVNALGEVFGMAAAALKLALQHPGIGLPYERGRKGKKEKKKGRGERKEDEPQSRLTEATQRRQRRDNHAAIGWPPSLFTYSLHTLSDRLRKLLTTHGRAEGTGACVTVRRDMIGILYISSCPRPPQK